MFANIFANLPTLETPRLLLRPLRQQDLDDLYAMTRDEQVARYIRRPVHSSREQAHAYLSGILVQYQRGEVAPWGVELRAEGRLVGTCGFFYWAPDDRRAEIYYALARDYWGQGLASEAAARTIAFGFERMALERIAAACWAENAASARVIEKLGMRYEGTLRRYVYVKGAFRDMRMYSILKEEYVYHKDTEDTEI